MQRVKGIENLNLGRLRAQGIVGAGVSTPTFTVSYRAVDRRQITVTGSRHDPTSFYR